MSDSGSSLKVGAKVTIVGKASLGEGTIRYIGEPSFQPGTWIGIELDQAGKHSTLLYFISIMKIMIKRIIRTMKGTNILAL